MGGDPWGGGAGVVPGSAHRLSAGEIRSQQQAVMEQQDQGLEELSKGLRRQQQMGFDMQDQITEHNGEWTHDSPRLGQLESVESNTYIRRMEHPAYGRSVYH